MENEIKTARYIALLAHAGQKDKGGHPYIEHLRFVASQCKDDAKIVAWLHDLLEDTKINYLEFWGLLKCFFGDKAYMIRDACHAITKRRGEKYEKYIARVKANPIARQVKIADLKHNLDLSRLTKITEKDLERAKKYKMALEFLESEE